MKVAVHQPQYLPWLGYFDKMDRADCFVLLDHVQFKKNEWQNRNRIKTAAGWQWLTVPVLHRFPQAISEVGVNNRARWSRKHLQALVLNYAAAPFFETHRAFFEEVYSRQWAQLIDLALETLGYLVDALGIQTKLVPASSLALREAEGKTERLIAICQALGGDTYLSGCGGLDYLDRQRFADAGIRLAFQDFRCPAYPQRFGPFEPNLSVVDLLFNCGSQSLSVLRQGRGVG
ncbi:MAG: WbqC family protein [Candidatus Rokubacteria bacterium]|nr:WbqC family protein [Candidatus Rokubacteria bacterium]